MGDTGLVPKSTHPRTFLVVTAVTTCNRCNRVAFSVPMFDRLCGLHGVKRNATDPSWQPFRLPSQEGGGDRRQRIPDLPAWRGELRHRDPEGAGDPRL